MDKKYIVNVLLYILIGAVAVFLIIFVLYHLLGWGNVNYSTRPAIRITAEDAIEGEAYLFRSEEVIYAPAGKLTYSELARGENVRQNDRVAGMYDCQKEQLAQLSAYDQTIAILREAENKESLSLIDGKLKALSSALRRQSDGQDSPVEKELISLQTELDRRKKTIGAVSDFGNEIARLTTLRKNLLAEMGTPDPLRAPTAGNFYPACDGYENLFAESKLSTITPLDFEELVKSAPETPPEGQQAAGKIVTDPRWRFAMAISSSRTVDLAQGRTYSLTLSSGEKVSAKLERLTADPESGRALLVFELTSLPDSEPSRCESVKLVLSTSSGLMVPTAAMRCVTGANGEKIMGVYVKDGNRFRFKKVKILSKHDGYYLAKEMTPDLEGYKEYLALNDIIVTAGKNLRVGYHE